MSKLYNDPLLRTSISLVASGAGQAKASGLSDSDRKQQVSQAVTSALLLASIIGLVQALVYSFAAAPIISLRRVSAGSGTDGHAAVVVLRGGPLMSGVCSIGIVPIGHVAYCTRGP